jgi:hypothetical protein
MKLSPGEIVALKSVLRVRTHLEFRRRWCRFSDRDQVTLLGMARRRMS